eukprot:3559324-Lingulodinium_polyedra.AAC.1
MLAWRTSRAGVCKSELGTGWHDNTVDAGVDAPRKLLPARICVAPVVLALPDPQTRSWRAIAWSSRSKNPGKR